ncbi:hypothetical protein QEN19_000892 [Hanseniaspora menglaensis]
MLYTIPQFPDFLFSIEIVSTKETFASNDTANVVFLNPKLIFSTSILFSALFKTIITYKNTNNKFNDQDFIRDIFINLLAVKNVKKVAFETFTNDPSAEECLKIELLQEKEHIYSSVSKEQSLEKLSETILKIRDLNKINEIYGTIEERKINDLIQMRGL